MGMYTGLKAEVVIKSSLLETMKTVVSQRKMALLLPVLTEEQKKVLQHYLTIDRHDQVFSLVGSGRFINYDGTSESWDLEEEGPSRLEGNVLKIYSSLKNYDRVLDTFIESILPMISEKIVFVETWYEEVDKPLKRV